MEKRSRSDANTDYSSWSKHKLTKELRNRGIAVATDRDKCIRRLEASDRGEPVPLALGKGPELQIVSEPVKIINTNYMDAEKPFYGIPIGVLRMICYYMSLGDLRIFGKTCKFIYLECFRPVLSARLYWEIANASNCKEKDKNTFIQIMNHEENRPVLTPKALAYFLYIVSKSKQGVIPKKFYSEFISALKIWGSIDT